MKSLNKVQIIGNLGRDPDMRYTPTGKAVTTFSVAVNWQYTDGGGEKHTGVEWVNVEAWGRYAEITNQYLVKGSPVYIEGRLSTDKWEKDGSTHYKTKVVLQDLIMLPNGSRKSTPEESDEPGWLDQPSDRPQEDDYEIPF